MNSFGSQSTLKVGNKSYEIFRLNALEAKGLSLGRLPYSLRVLLENLLRQEDGKSVTADDIEFSQVAGEGRTGERDRIYAGSGPDAGFYRGSRGGRSGGHARCHEAARGGPGRDQA